MKRFLKLLILFLFPILLFGITAEILLRNIPNDYEQKRESLDQHADSIQVLFLGSSHALCGINPECIPDKKSFNAAFVSQSLDIDNAIIKKYDSQWEQLEYIVIPLSYFSLLEKLSDSVEDWRITSYNIYFQLNISKQIQYRFEILGNKLWYNLLRIYNYYGLGKSERFCHLSGWKELADRSVSDLNKNGIARATAHTITDPKFLNENINVLDSIIQYASRRNIKVLFYTPPGGQTYMENLNKNQMEQVIQIAREMTSRNSNVYYINFMNDRSFTDADFSDADHLNRNGAKKLSLKINDWIEQMETQQEHVE